MIPHCPVITGTPVAAGFWFGNVLSPAVQAAVFGEEFSEDLLITCQKHYNYLKKRDGIDLGYRRHNGKITAYVKNEGF